VGQEGSGSAGDAVFLSPAATSFDVCRFRLAERKETMIRYLLHKVGEQDWHGVSDAANDLREIEVELRFQR
jgi:hypothetical protein